MEVLASKAPPTSNPISASVSVSVMTKSKYHMENVMRFRQFSLEDRNEVHTVRRLGCPSNKCWNPSDIYCIKSTAVVRFRANWPISVVSYGFYGPWGEDGGKYHMEIEVLTEDFTSIAQTKTVTPFIKSKELFHVKFDNAVPILPCTWYYAKFSLLGPPTGESTSCACRQGPIVVECGDDKVQFTFEEPESNQLPEISFTLTY